MSKRKDKKRAARARLHGPRKARPASETASRTKAKLSLEQEAHHLGFHPITDDTPHYLPWRPVRP
ncbi:hypothetical protein [Deinococcus peraridilitoris]|uniref:Uncharacterized protein n=1 Tax=Deinococcus peraridilitoris (strain DSM 19664 / LMG 22246 / CIP 109416 / KR-200) TaxID=937777 RepID=K9ZWY1_DEIPD|nr:hypothetical protein [Deinococcus peraridilitoris]AFZ66081.1 hypothetical protein Deipe_0485 [Deinococcus peraridilitoris DSM 19664]